MANLPREIELPEDDETIDPDLQEELEMEEEDIPERPDEDED